MNPLTWWQQLKAPAVRPQAAFWMEKILQEKRAALRENLPFHGKMLLALTKMLKIEFFRGFYSNSLHHF